MTVISVRVVEVIPGKSVVGIEIPNENREMVRLKDIFASPEYEKSKSPLTLALGKDVAGAPAVTDIGRMPHLFDRRNHRLRQISRGQRHADEHPLQGGP